MAPRRHEGACPRAPAVTCSPPEFAPCLPVPPMSDGKGHETAHRPIRGGTFLPHCRTGGPLGGTGEPPGGRRAAWGESDRPPPAACATGARSGGRRAALDRASGNVAPGLERRRVSCIRPRGGKTLRTLGYELPHLLGERAALIRGVPQEHMSCRPGGVTGNGRIGFRRGQFPSAAEDRGATRR